MRPGESAGTRPSLDVARLASWQIWPVSGAGEASVAPPPWSGRDSEVSPVSCCGLAAVSPGTERHGLVFQVTLSCHICDVAKEGCVLGQGYLA